MKNHRIDRYTSGAAIALLLFAVQPASGQVVKVDTKGNLEADGDVTTRMNLTVGGNLTTKTGKVTDSLNVGGTVTAQTGKVNDDLTVDGILTTQTGKVNGNLTVDGTATVTNKLTVNDLITGTNDLKISGNAYLGGTHLIFASNNGVIDWGPTGSLFFRTLTTKGDNRDFKDRMAIDQNGHVFIPGNVTVGEQKGGAPDRMAKLEVRGDIGDKTWQAFNFYARGNPWEGTHAGSTAAHNQKYSIYADKNVGANYFIAFSDARIKNIQGHSDGAGDLKTLLGIEITDYRYKDVVNHGDGLQKKVIAQQVETVFPQAVSQHTDVVPDIYKMAPLRDGWVELATDLKKGERVSLIVDAGQGVYTVTEVTKDGFRTNLNSNSDKVFVFGREVNDFRAVDYDAIAMLNVSATQQIKKEKDAEISALQAENARQRARIEALESRDKVRDAQIAAIQTLLSRKKP